MSTLLYLLLNLCCLVIAQDNRDPDPNNQFVFPPLPGPQYSNDPTVFEKNLNFTVGKSQSQPFKWISNMTSMSIILCQEGNPDSVQTHTITDCIDGTSEDFLYWDGDIGSIDLKNGSQAYLGVWNCSDFTTPVFFSHYMNLVEAPAQSSTTSSSATSSSSTATSLPTAAATTPAPLTTSGAGSTDSQKSTDSSSGGSNAAAIGGGIGGGIGGALILIAAAFAFWKWKSGKANNQQQQQPTQQIANWANNDYNAMSVSSGSNVYKLPHQTPELYSSPHSVSELPQSGGGNGPYPEQRYEMSSERL
ncbi:uncharacterized protein F4822DRAFT_386680 [Hypoxylon trugodes]|uniref:uncharacterized protein n=1 Tax=Hypoxylon trugodes TaxID=326681 RepID=UPI0021946BE3|nr:uncharacterized protein F4822DRAFT_386680 [Hypoxylon trugodes]KAI1393977.1 hypothetical protein F4822DRAFT_386680 [Hypoxylon trugodes]